MNKIQQATLRLAQSCDGSPVSTTIVVMLFFIMFSVFEATVETVFFGHRFEHLLDPFFQLAFIGYSAYAVYWCAVFNSTKASNALAQASGAGRVEESTGECIASPAALG